MSDTDVGCDRRSDDGYRVDRRTVLKTAGVTATGAAGLAGAAGSATAQFGGLDVDVIQIDGDDWSADGSLPVVDELLVFIHGWFGDTGAASQAEDVANSMNDAGYEADAYVALEWPATTINYFGAEGDTENVGEVAAGLAEDFYDAGGGAIRLVGHSLGGRCVLWTPTKLGSGYEIETVAALGAAANGSDVCGDPWNDGLDDACEVRNYHSGNDSTVGSAYGWFGDTALGNEGANCTSPASNYTDVDVTDSVSSHMDFLGNSAVGSDLADAIASGSCQGDGGDGGGGDDDDDDDGGGFDWFGGDDDGDDDDDGFGWFSWG